MPRKPLLCPQITFSSTTDRLEVEIDLDSHVLLPPLGWQLSSTSHSIHWPRGALMLSSMVTAPNFLVVKSGSEKTSLLQERGATRVNRAVGSWDEDHLPVQSHIPSKLLTIALCFSQPPKIGFNVL